MKRVDYTLTEKQIESVKKIADGSGLTVSELIRRAVDDWLIKQRRTEMELGSTESKNFIESDESKRVITEDEVRRIVCINNDEGELGLREVADCFDIDVPVFESYPEHLSKLRYLILRTCDYISKRSREQLFPNALIVGSLASSWISIMSGFEVGIVNLPCPTVWGKLFGMTVIRDTNINPGSIYVVHKPKGKPWSEVSSDLVHLIYLYSDEELKNKTTV